VPMLSLGLSQLSSSASKRDIAGSFVAGADDFAFTGSDAVGVWLNGHGSCRNIAEEPIRLGSHHGHVCFDQSRDMPVTSSSETVFQFSRSGPGD
jgi:hypothetical protein